MEFIYILSEGKYSGNYLLAGFADLESAMFKVNDIHPNEPWEKNDFEEMWLKEVPVYYDSIEQVEGGKKSWTLWFMIEKLPVNQVTVPRYIYNADE